MFPALEIGPLVIPTGVFALLLGGWLALSVVERAAPRVGGVPAHLYALATAMIVAGIIGARLSFVFLHWDAFQENLLGIVWPLNSGYELWGGLLFALAAAWLQMRRDQLALGTVLDGLLPGLLTMLVFVSLSDFLGGSGYGVETTMPWGLRLFDLPVKRHPVQLYEVLVGLTALGSWVYLVRGRTRLPAGANYTRNSILIPSAIYAGGRLFVEAFRANSVVVGDGWRVVQLLCLAVLAAALWLYAAAAPAGSENGVKAG